MGKLDCYFLLPIIPIFQHSIIPIFHFISISLCQGNRKEDLKVIYQLWFDQIQPSPATQHLGAEFSVCLPVGRNRELMLSIGIKR
jgi:hypothetical protein